VGCDFLDLTFYFFFAGLSVVGNWSTLTRMVRFRSPPS
jgi:hypothetical protein